MLKKVRELPASVRNPRESVIAKDVREFCRNQTYEVAEVIIEGKTVRQITQLLRQYIKRHPEQCKGVSAAARNGKAYLYREVAR